MFDYMKGILSIHEETSSENYVAKTVSQQNVLI